MAVSILRNYTLKYNGGTDNESATDRKKTIGYDSIRGLRKWDYVNELVNNLNASCGDPIVNDGKYAVKFVNGTDCIPLSLQGDRYQFPIDDGPIILAGEELDSYSDLDVYIHDESSVSKIANAVWMIEWL